MPSIYFLPKIHKEKKEDTETFAGRPIIATVGEMLKSLDEFLAHLTAPLLHLIPWSLADTRGLINGLERFKNLSNNTILFLADVEALYPSIPWNEGISSATKCNAANLFFTTRREEERPASSAEPQTLQNHPRAGPQEELLLLPELEMVPSAKRDRHGQFNLRVLCLHEHLHVLPVQDTPWQPSQESSLSRSLHWRPNRDLNRTKGGDHQQPLRRRDGRKPSSHVRHRRGQRWSPRPPHQSWTGRTTHPVPLPQTSWGSWSPCSFWPVPSWFLFEFSNSAVRPRTFFICNWIIIKSNSELSVSGSLTIRAVLFTVQFGTIWKVNWEFQILLHSYVKLFYNVGELTFCEAFYHLFLLFQIILKIDSY